MVWCKKQILTFEIIFVWNVLVFVPLIPHQQAKKHELAAFSIWHYFWRKQLKAYLLLHKIFSMFEPFFSFLITCMDSGAPTNLRKSLKIAFIIYNVAQKRMQKQKMFSSEPFVTWRPFRRVSVLSGHYWYLKNKDTNGYSILIIYSKNRKTIFLFF